MSNASGKKCVAYMTVLFALIGATTGASAGCVGGSSIKGSFGVTVNGPAVGGATAQVYTGILKADGKCGLKGSLTGGTFGQPSVTQAVTATYSVPNNEQGTVSIQLPGTNSPVVFDIGLISDGKFGEVTGIATNGPALATIDFVEIAKHAYGLADLSGTYVATCTGAGNDGSGGLGAELVYFTFDGEGNITGVSVSDSNGNFHSNTVAGTYSVDKTGAFAIQYPGQNSRYIVYGEIVSDGTELRSVFIDTTSGFGPYRSCAIKKQS